jgi:N-acetyl-anhydromuramyl-L-alanine amidase AmpD
MHTEAPILYDLRDEQTDPHPKTKRTRVRKPEDVDAVVLHQAGVEFGAGRGRPLRYRALGVSCHAMGFRDGSAVLTTPPLWRLSHANRLNGRSVGLEIDGLYPGVRGGAVRQGEATAEVQITVEAGRLALRALVAAARADGCPIRYILAHCQADSWRKTDPGQWLWQEVALACGVDELGLETQPELTTAHHSGPRRHGLPIPDAWRLPTCEG